MIDIRLDESALRNQLETSGASEVSNLLKAIFEVDIMPLPYWQTLGMITDEAVENIFKQAILNAVIARALLEIINAQMTDDAEVTFDRIVEQTSEEIAATFSGIRSAIITSSTTPKVQA